nr:retrovirus-related Pol polyprotein from transposon TNT 1-94 [Tanacetum cinerariifolium]
PTGEALRKYIHSGPYKPTTVVVQDVEATDDSLAVPEHTTVETPMNMSTENKAHFEAEKEAIHLILTGIRDEIYSTVDACQTAQEIWEAIERLQQARMVKVDEVSYHKLFDIMKQYQNEVNELRAERLEINANPLALVATAQANQDPYCQTSRKPKRVKDSVYHKEKMLLCKQAEQGVPLLAEQYDWLEDIDEEVYEQELEAHYIYMAKIQEVPTTDSNIDSEPVEQIVQLILFIGDYGCTKHMTGNLKLLCNFVEKFLESTSSTPLCLMAKASLTQAWLWHQRLFHLNFDYINLLLKKDIVIGLPKLKYVKDQLCSSCELSKAKRSSFKSKGVSSSKGRLNLLHMDLCGPIRVASINEKKFILVIVDDYSRYTWTLFLRSKDEKPEVLKEFLMMIQRNLQAPVITVRTDRGT